MRALWTACILLASLALGFAQSTPRSSRTDLAVDSVLKSLAAATYGRVPWDGRAETRSEFQGIVLLVDTSQAGVKPSYINFARTFSSRLLARLARRLPNGDAKVWVYPYQLDLYTDSGRCVEAAALTAENASNVVTALPPVEYGETAAGGRYSRGDGHDSSGARAALLSHLADQGVTDSVLVVQLTTSTLNEAPRDAGLDAQIRPLDARNSGLDGTAFRRVATPSPFDSEPPTVDVHVWSYVPGDWLEPIGPREETWWERYGAAVMWIGGVVLFLITVAGVGYFLMGMAGPIEIGFDDEARISLGRGKSVNVYAFGNDVPPNDAISLSEVQTDGGESSIPKGELLGRISRDWFGKVTCTGLAGFKVYQGSTGHQSVALKRGDRYRFRKTSGGSTSETDALRYVEGKGP